MKNGNLFLKISEIHFFVLFTQKTVELNVKIL